MADVAVIDMSFFKVDIMEVNIRKAVKGDCKAIRYKNDSYVMPIHLNC